MKNTLRILSVCLLAAVVAQADVFNLNLPAAGSNGVGTVVSTAVTHSSGATFDIVYTLGATANGANPWVNATSTQMGIGSDGDISQHYNTLEGNDGEGMSFTSLSIANFVANESEYVLADLEGLTFSSITFGSVANNQDGVNLSFTGFGVDTVNQTLNNANTGGTPFTLDLTGLTNHISPETAVYLETDNVASSNRWSIEGIGVTVIPEPSSLGLAVAAAGGLLFIRRRFKS